MRIGVLGGSFDPVHTGHLIVAECARSHLRLDQVRFVVAREQPIKGEAGHRESPERRLDMVRLATADNPRFVADPRELDRAGPSYTVDTLEDLRREFPEDELFLLVGSDAVADLGRWREPERLAELARLIEIPRSGIEFGKSRLITGSVPVPRIEIASEQIREKIARGETVRYLVPDPVLEYMSQHGLYRTVGKC